MALIILQRICYTRGRVTSSESIIRYLSTKTAYKMAGSSKLYPMVEKSALDKREYRGLELANKMKVLLISDPLTDKSAASLSVAAGSMCDPEKLPGLAHFCEHMLFLGTKKYEAENEYSKYLSENAGSSNAYTARDHTNYYFDVAPKSLRPCLDRFSQFFISPLFTESATEREVNAVHSEHEKNITNDSWRAHQLDVGTTDPKHPYSHFATGNRDTLWELPRSQDVDVRNALMEYHRNYYSANLMSLCILGSESLDELQEMAEEMFSEVENHDVEAPRWPETPYSKEVLGTRIEIVPVKDLRLLTIMFPIPDTTSRYKTSGEGYLSHLIGHEGAGSLLSLLKEKNWVNHLEAGSHVPARGFGIFKISVDLTPEGMKNVDEITVHVFQYLQMLSEMGPQKWVWEEMRDVNSMLFRFKDKERPQSLVSHVTSVMHEIPVNEVLSAGYLLTDYDTKLIQTLLDLLNPQNCRIAVTAQEFDSKANLTEKWYGVKYSLNPLHPDLVQRWKECGNHSMLALPPRNEFIPSEFDLKRREADTGIIPTMADKKRFQRLWFLQDNEFNMPKASVRIEIYSHLPLLDPVFANLNNLFASCIKDQLTEYSYAASVAGLNYNVVDTVHGLEISVAGYDHKLPTLLTKVMDRVLNFKPDPKRFEVLKEYYTRGLKNWENEQPYLHASYYLTYLLREKRWSNAELLETVEAATLESLISFADEFVSKTKLEWVVCGNVNYKETESLVSEIETMFTKNSSQILLPAQSKRIREVNLQSGQNYVYCKQHPTHLSSCAAILFQTGLQSDRENVLLELLEHICTEPCFHQLRTQEQLGYVVYSNIRRASGTQGMTIVVQSDRHPPFLETRIEDFLRNFESLLKNMSEEEFLTLRNSLHVRKSEKPKKLIDRANMIWNEVSSQQYNFDRQNVEIKELESVTLPEIIECFEKFIAPDSTTKKKLSVYVISKNKWMDKQEDLDELKNFPKPTYTQDQIINVEEWKKGQGLYPLGKPLISFGPQIGLDFTQLNSKL